MSHRLLVIGNKNYSSWSLRAWLALTMPEIPFTEQRIALDEPGTAEAIRRHSPAGRVPILVEGDVVWWDSLAIVEHAAELAPALWPAAPAARATARSIAAEMHSGFQALRNELPMNVRASGRKVAPSRAALADIDRIKQIWRDARSRFGDDGPWLFGTFSAADAMFAPVASRFATYGVALDEPLRAYQATVLGCPAMQRWAAAAAVEPERLEHEEVG